MSDVERQILEVLGEALEPVSIERLDGGEDAEGEVLVETRSGERLRLQLVARRPVRRRELRGDFATGVLRLRALTSDGETAPVVVILVPKITTATSEEIARFMTAYAPDVGWGLVDDQGGYHLALPGRGAKEAAGNIDAPSVSPLSSGRSSQMFTDLNRLFLKLILLQGAPSKLWESRRRGPIANPVQLAALAGSSNESAYRFARTFREAGFLRRLGGELRIVRRDELLRELLRHDRLILPRCYPVRSVWGRMSPLELVDFLKDPSSRLGILAGFEACRQLDILHTRLPFSELYIERPVRELIDRFDLEPVSDTSEADVVLVEPPYGRSVSIAAGWLHDTHRIVDPIQAALDVVRHPDRGQEQAEYVLGDVLGLLEGDE